MVVVMLTMRLEYSSLPFQSQMSPIELLLRLPYQCCYKGRREFFAFRESKVSTAFCTRRTCLKVKKTSVQAFKDNMNDAIIDDDYQNVKSTASSKWIYTFTLSYRKWEKSVEWNPGSDKCINFQLPTQVDFIGLMKKKTQISLQEEEKKWWEVQDQRTSLHV